MRSRNGGNYIWLRVSPVPIIFGKMDEGVQVAGPDDMHEIIWYVDISSGVRFLEAGADLCGTVLGLVLPSSGKPASGVADTLKIYCVSEFFVAME